MKKVFISSLISFFLAIFMNAAGSVEIAKPTAVDEIIKVSTTSPFCKDTYKTIVGTPELLASASGGDTIIRSDDSDTRYFIKVGSSCVETCDNGKTISITCKSNEQCTCSRSACNCRCYY